MKTHGSEAQESSQASGGLTFLYSSVKQALRGIYCAHKVSSSLDNINTLDFSRKNLQEYKKQQLRYHINTHDSEQSVIQENVSESNHLEGTGRENRRPST